MKTIHTTVLTLLMFIATISISFGQPLITNQPATQATAPGATVTFQVGASSIEPIAYQWQKNPGNGFADLADRTNAALVLANVQPGDAGDYRVVVIDKGPFPLHLHRSRGIARFGKTSRAEVHVAL
jgi:Immunoglobulin domain